MPDLNWQTLACEICGAPVTKVVVLDGEIVLKACSEEHAEVAQRVFQHRD